MSDNLSEDEINALLNPASDKLTPLLEDFLRVNRRVMPGFANALGDLVNKDCRLSDPQVLLTSPGDILNRLPYELIDVRLNFRGTYSGLHSYYLDTSEAPQIVRPMGVESDELDATSLSAIGEAFSNSVHAQLRLLDDLFAENISPEAPNVQVVQRDSLALTPPVFTLLYDILFDGEKALSVIEVINQDLAESIGKVLHSEDDVEDFSTAKATNVAKKVEGVSFPSFRAAEIGPQEEQNLGLLMDVPVTLAVELGRTRWQLRDVLTIGEGSIIELDKQAGELVDVLVNNNLIARGEVVVVDENFSVRITEIISSFEQLVQKGL